MVDIRRLAFLCLLFVMFILIGGVSAAQGSVAYTDGGDSDVVCVRSQYARSG